MSLFHMLKDKVKDRRAEAIKQYRELLQRSDTATEEDSVLLTELMDILGKTTEDVRRDLGTVQEHSRLSSLAAETPAAQAEAERLQKVLAEVLEADERARAELDRLLNASRCASSAANGRAMICQRCINDLDGLSNRNFELFGKRDPEEYNPKVVRPTPPLAETRPIPEKGAMQILRENREAIASGSIPSKPDPGYVAEQIRRSEQGRPTLNPPAPPSKEVLDHHRRLTGQIL